MKDHRFLGHILNYDCEKDIITIKVDFLDMEKQEIIEQIAKEKTIFSFCFSRPFRKSKAYYQLKYYFKLLKQIVIGFGVTPSSEVIKSLDNEHKKRCFPSQNIDLGNQVIPVVKSKADMTFEEMKYLTDELKDTYSEILIQEEFEGEGN
ncbi:MAG TPA: hypothetical protein PLU55_01325 [Candidatus Pacearchaeota archaeon]|nr:hypothetical protein [Candidatus Pacearchaeota archaeon]